MRRHVTKEATFELSGTLEAHFMESDTMTRNSFEIAQVNMKIGNSAVSVHKHRFEGVEMLDEEIHDGRVALLRPGRFAIIQFGRIVQICVFKY
jgi:hypothetical protein